MSYSGVRYVAVWSVLVGLLALPIPARAQARESRYQGRTLAEWQGDLEKRPLEVRQQAAQALAHFGPVAAPALVQTLRDVSPEVRQAAAIGLSGMREAAKEAVPALAQALGDLDVRVRQVAPWVLGTFGPAAEVAVPELIRAIRDPNNVVQAEAASALAAIGPAAKDAAVALALVAQGAHTYVGGNIMNALRAIGPAAIPELQKEADSDPELRPLLEAAIRILGNH